MLAVLASDVLFAALTCVRSCGVTLMFLVVKHEMACKHQGHTYIVEVTE